MPALTPAQPCHRRVPQGCRGAAEARRRCPRLVQVALQGCAREALLQAPEGCALAPLSLSVQVPEQEASTLSKHKWLCGACRHSLTMHGRLFRTCSDTPGVKQEYLVLHPRVLPVLAVL